jgi:hypothetical protein
LEPGCGEADEGSAQERRGAAPVNGFGEAAFPVGWIAIMPV